MEDTSLFEVTLGEYKNPEETLREITEFIKSGIEKNRQKFKKPDDDWLPVYLVAMPDGKSALCTSTADKHVLVQFIADLAKQFGAVGIGQPNSSWRRVEKDKLNLPIGSIAGKPGSEEGLMLVVYTRTLWQLEWAPIRRDGKKPPTLAPWETMLKREKGSEAAGLMFDPLFQALRKN